MHTSIFVSRKAVSPEVYLGPNVPDFVTGTFIIAIRRINQTVLSKIYSDRLNVSRSLLWCVKPAAGTKCPNSQSPLKTPWGGCDFAKDDSDVKMPTASQPQEIE